MKLKLVATRQETKDVKSFIFQPEQPLSWQAGQYLYYSLPHQDEDDRKDKRWFTNSAAPSEGHVMITTRFTPDTGSSFKKALFSLPIGTEIEAEEPEGDFVVDDPNKDYIFIAGGIGITPYRSILTEAAAKGQSLRVHLLYAYRSDDIPFRQELDSMAAKNPQLKIDYIVNPQKINDDVLKEALAQTPEAIVYVSGPEPMVEDLKDTLMKLGVEEDRIKTDYFPGYPVE